MSPPRLAHRRPTVGAGDPPTPLFPASRALLDAWRNRPAPPGWAVYPAGAPS